MKTTFTNFKTLLFGFTILLGSQTLNSQDLDVEIYGITPNNYMTPSVQFGCYNFGIYSNFFDTTATDLTLHFYIIEDNSGNEIFSDSISITANSLEDLYLPNCFEPGANFGSYTGYYNLTTNLNDPDLSNNKDTIHFAISENTFANESGGTQSIVPDGSNWEDQEPHSWAFGNFFHINYGTLESNYKAESATFSLGNAGDPGLEGRKISVYLYKWDDDPNEDGNMDPDERTLVAFSDYKITGEEQMDDLINIPFYNFPNGELELIDLESNQNYVLMVEYSTLDQVDVEFVISKEIDYAAMIFFSEQMGDPRYAAMLGVNGDLSSERYSSIGFGTEYVPVVRLNLTDGDIIDKVANNLSFKNKLELSPNPADNVLSVEIDFPETQKECVIKIFDINGRILKQENYKNLKYEKINFDLTKFVPGTYFLQFVSEAGIRTERFLVHH